MNNITAELTGWSRESFGKLKFLMGKINFDTKERWPNGTRIHTSYIVHEEDAGDYIIFTTRNSVYQCAKHEQVQGGQKISKSN
jgi:phosphopentomutase